MRILILGGTRFVGRAMLEAAVGAGHEVTVFHRGESEPADLPATAAHVHGDRDDGLGALAGATWDAAIDTCAYAPRQVREAARALAGAAGHYTLVSTISVYPEGIAAGANEDTPVVDPPARPGEEVTGATYGPLKVGCEQEARAAFGGRCLIVRPGYVVGPHDPTDRFTSWVRRAAAGGRMLAPGDPEAPVQVVDARDLASFVLGRVAARDGSVYAVVGPAVPTTMRELLATMCDVGDAGTTLAWVAAAALGRLGDEARTLVPLWDPESPGHHLIDASRARAAGLRNRPLAETVGDTLRWDRARGSPPLRCGLPRELERLLIATA